MLSKKKVITCSAPADCTSRGGLDKIQVVSTDKRVKFVDLFVLFTIQVIRGPCSKSGARNKGQISVLYNFNKGQGQKSII